MSLLERSETGTGSERKTEITLEQIAKGIDVIRPYFDKEFTLEPCEMVALHSYINSKPSDVGDAQLRFDIVQAGWRQEQGLPLNERHLGVFVIRKMLHGVDLRSFEADSEENEQF